MAALARVLHGVIASGEDEDDLAPGLSKEMLAQLLALPEGAGPVEAWSPEAELEAAETAVTAAEDDDNDTSRVSIPCYGYMGEYQGEGSGEGEFVCPDGAVYNGQYLDGLKHGRGRLMHADGAVYEGMRHLMTVCVRPVGSLYQSHSQVTMKRTNVTAVDAWNTPAVPCTRASGEKIGCTESAASISPTGTPMTATLFGANCTVEDDTPSAAAMSTRASMRTTSSTAMVGI